MTTSTRTATHRPRSDRSRSDRSNAADRMVVIMVLLVATGAWVLLAYGSLGHGPTASPGAPDATPIATGGHGQHAVPGTDQLSPTVVRLAGWAVMVVAMMLPPALPLVLSLRSVTRRRRGSLALTVWGTAAFTSAWVVAGVVLVVADWAVGSSTPAGTWLGRHPQLVAGTAAILAGLYQFSPLKKACLTACRSPRQLVLTEWRGHEPGSDVTRIGLRYGLVCVGCCWALMLLTLVVGWPALPLMVVLSTVMAAERLLPRVRPLVPLIAVAAIALGIALLVGLVPAGHLLGGQL